MKRLGTALALFVAAAQLALAQTPGEPVPTTRPDAPASVSPDMNCSAPTSGRNSHPAASSFCRICRSNEYFTSSALTLRPL